MINIGQLVYLEGLLRQGCEVRLNTSGSEEGTLVTICCYTRHATKFAVGKTLDGALRALEREMPHPTLSAPT